MMHRLKRNAAEELLASVRYYEAQMPGLGGEFLDEVDSAIKTIAEAPNRWPEMFDHFRRYRLNRFPFQIIYEVKNEIIVIAAVAHLHRMPGYWQERS